MIKTISDSFFYTVSAMLVVAIMVLFSRLGEIEGWLSPVIENYEIKRIYSDGSGGAIIDAAYEKVRGCDFVSIEWWYKSGSQAVLVDVHRSSAVIRKKGLVLVNGVRVNIKPDQVRDGSHAYVYHQCHPLWETKTKFY